MVEMAETSDILRSATDKSLVILDELGRGTATYDGMAIASAVLEHMVQDVRCKILFITHYPLVATDLQRKYPQELENLHMGFAEDTHVDGTKEITFLYRLSEGIASGSFGVECGRLAALPERVLEIAAAQSENLKEKVERRYRQNKYVLYLNRFKVVAH
jgi:DNA mismatch repair protein MSH3